jgi:cytochrome P450
MSILSQIGIDSTSQVVWVLVYGFVSYIVFKWIWISIYNLYFHPLSKFPGPKLWLLFPITRQIDSVRGVRERKSLRYHEKYGNVVRCGPSQLTFNSPEAWKDIYGHGHPELPKENHVNNPKVTSVINARSSADHFRHRRALLPAFSDKALGEQQHIILGYVDLLMTRLDEAASSGQPTNMVQWFNMTTFDLMADLAFGEILGALEGRTSTNIWLKRVEQSLRMLPLLALLRGFIPGFGMAIASVARKAQDEHEAMIKDLVQKRIGNAKLEHRGDFMDQMMRSRGKEQELSDVELAANGDVMMIAGSETTATLLAGVTYLLLTHPKAMERLTQEVRGAFKSKEEITLTAASSKLPYMLACLNEALRIYPPVASVIFRQTLPGPPTPISGYMVPEEVRLLLFLNQ